MSLSLLSALFFGAFFDATLGTCFFVFGEAFFLLAGGLAYSDHAWQAVAAVFAGAYAADQTGYLIGHRLRPWFRRFALATRLRRANYRKALVLLNRHGIKAVAVSRLLGPVAWFMPAICGSVGLPWPRFAAGSALGVLLGCLFAIYIDQIFAFVNWMSGGQAWDPSIRGIYYLPAKLQAGDVLSAVGLSLGLSFVVTLFPARRAARMNPVEALRYE